MEEKSVLTRAEVEARDVEITKRSEDSRKAQHWPDFSRAVLLRCCGSTPLERYYLDVSGTHVVLLLSYLKPGAFFSASLVVSIVR